MTGDEAHVENVMNFLHSALSHDFVRNHISPYELECILRKIVKSTSSLGSISQNALEFSKFIADFVNKDNNFSDSIKLATLIAFSKQLAQFCTRMQFITGENFCIKNVLIQDWISSIVLNGIENEEKFADKVPFLEAFSNLQRYSKSSCNDLMDLGKDDSKNLWTLLNCHRHEPCNKEGKAFHAKLFEDKNLLVNIRIAAFLALMECSNEKDLELVGRVVKGEQSENDELVTFIKGYFGNMKSNGILEGHHICLTEDEETAVCSSSSSNADNSNNAPKLTRASNTLFYREVVNRAYLLETNILYFDEPAMIPQLITAKFNYGSVSAHRNSSFVAKWQNTLQMEIYIDDARNDQQALNFHLTVVVRFLDLPILTKQLTISQQGLIQLAHLFQRNLQRSFVTPIGSFLNERLFEVIKGTVDVDILEMATLINGNQIFPTLSGIQQRILWRMDSFLRLVIAKEDCSDLLRKPRDTSCTFELRPDVNLDGQIYIATGSASRETGFLMHSNVSITLPIELLLSKPDYWESKIKVKIPSSILHVLEGNDHILEAVDVEQNIITSTQGISHMRLGPRGKSEEGNEKTMNIEIRSGAKNLTLQVIHPYYEAVLNAGLEPLISINGHYSCLTNSTHPKTSSFQVAVQNTDDHKLFQTKLTRGSDEYLLDAYFRRVIHVDNSTHSGYHFSCQRGKGLLCSWPFCSFCSTEVFSGATVSTPTFKNIKLFEGSVTQVFPNKELNILLRTGGVPLIKNGELKATVKYGKDFSVFQTSRLKDGLDGKLSQFFPSPPPPVENGMGDALPESETIERTDPVLALSIETELRSEVLGHGALSAMYAAISEKTTIMGGGIFYSWKKNEEKLTLLATVHNPDFIGANISRNYVSKASLRSSQFPIVNLDLTIHGQLFNTPTLATQMFTVKPINLMTGDIRLEVIDKTGDIDEYIIRKLRANWPEIHIDRTYKIYLPKHLHYHVIKGTVFIKRTNNVLQRAGLEALIGLDHAFEIKYERPAEENGNAFKVLTSILTRSGTYGLHHRIEQIQESSENDDDTSLIALEDDELALEKYKYRGTYVFGEISLKASGVFVARKGREILPFSKFGIRLKSLDGKDGGRIIGEETVHETMHNMQIAVKSGDINLFEFKNEINPSSQHPFKASISIKDYTEVKIHDNSKFTNTRDFQVKAKWLPGRAVVLGKIAFPTSSEEPLYLDVDVSLERESDMENPMFKVISRSSIDFASNSSLSTENTFQTPNAKWEFGLDGFYESHEEDGYSELEDRYINKNLKNVSFSAHFLPPNSNKYSLKTAGHHFSINHKTSGDKLYIDIERPQVTPFHLHLEVADDGGYKYTSSYTDNEDDYETNTTNLKNLKFTVKFCHKDNFLYIFPMLEADFGVEAFGEISDFETSHYYSPNSDVARHQMGELWCKSKGVSLPLCNQVNLSYKLNSKRGDRDGKRLPWAVNITATNEQSEHTDEAHVKLLATYEPVRAASEMTGFEFYYEGILYEILNTVRYGDQVLKYSYNFEYDLQRKDGSNKTMVGINGTYIFTQIYESLNFFEFSDQLRWSQMDGEKFHIWTNLLNHTTDSNLTSESATFSSQYASLGDLVGDVDGDASNITWMELRTKLSSSGLGTLQTLILDPSKILCFSEGEIEADLLIRTEFSPLKTFRVQVSHDQSKTENEDDESTKYGVQTKLNGIFNTVEISAMNSLTLSMGKLIGIGESIMGRHRSREGIYEYVTINAFGLVPTNVGESGGDNVAHFDLSSSWTNSEDDDTDLRIVNDVIFKSPLRQVPLFRFAYFKNSTDLEVERNGSLLIYPSSANLKRTEELRLPDTIMSDGLDDLSFTQTSLQSISQQIIDDYSVATNSASAQDEDDWFDYNFEVKSSSDIQNKTFNYKMKAKWLGFKEKLYHCQSSLDTCSDYSDIQESHEDISNYCNLVALPLKHVLYLFY